MEKERGIYSEGKSTSVGFHYDASRNPAKTKTNAIEIPSVSLPKGGGAIRGIDEKFSVNKVNGTSSLAIPLPFASARGGAPSLSLSYNSGSGNGIFGMGWNLGLASIKRKTDRGLPSYNDLQESDTFLFSEAEDLVPAFRIESGKFIKNGDGVSYELDEWDSVEVPVPHFRIRRYVPRTQGLFARIERWTEKSTGKVSWRVISRDNVTTLFGWNEGSRIFDPQDSLRIFEWLPEFVFDDKGNCCHYKYRREDREKVPAVSLHNANRLEGSGAISYANLYLEEVRYGNSDPYTGFGSSFPQSNQYCFTTVFDYTSSAEATVDNSRWEYRGDAFSNYKSGFEIRTTRLCRRVLLFHDFPGKYSGLVKSLEFGYQQSSGNLNFLSSVTSRGYLKKTDGSYSSKSLPPLEFEYQKHSWSDKVQNVDPEDVVHAPAGLSGPYQFTDLYNEGVSGILSEQENGWFYKRNLGDGHFENATLVSEKPSFSGLGGSLQLADLGADGGKQLVSYYHEPKGYFELTTDERWAPFRSFERFPNVPINDPSARMLDLNGDGRPEVVLTEENAFTWYESEGREGFGPVRRSLKHQDEEQGPAIVFSDPAETIYLADMSGDGLTDIVRIRNGEVCYWPNMGNGKFGKKIAMDNAPLFDEPDAFDSARVRLADIDGSGTADIVYLGDNRFLCWMNLSGNSFEIQPFEIPGFPEIHQYANISVLDLLGNGLSCIVWSSNLEKDAGLPLKYVDLMNSKKPHIMTSYRNNMGKEVTMEYTASTKFYLEDRKAGNPWVTKLHFPVHCLSRVITEDKVSGYQFVNVYTYHHGYYDHAEREFRGFGRVDQKDWEDFKYWKKKDQSLVTNVELVDDSLHQKPMMAKTWLHTGGFLDSQGMQSAYGSEFWHKAFESRSSLAIAPEAALPVSRVEIGSAVGNSAYTLNTLEWREAFRACKGMTLRSEVFARDAPDQNATQAQLDKEKMPYQVTTGNCLIELLQPQGQNRNAVFIAKEGEAVTYHYERTPDDPRIAHSLNVKYDDFGNVTQAAAVVYPRSKQVATLPHVTQNAQQALSITYTENSFTQSIDNRASAGAARKDAFRTPLPSESKTHHLIYNLDKVITDGELFSTEDFKNVLTASTSANYEEYDKRPSGASPQRRLIEHTRTLYRSNNLVDPMPQGFIDTMALPYENYQLAFTKSLLKDIFQAKCSDVDLASLMQTGKFVADGDTWWISSGTMQFFNSHDPFNKAAERFYMPVSYTDPMGAITRTVYDDFKLAVKSTIDDCGNTTQATKFNYRTMSPVEMQDMNGNYSAVIHDELGLVKAMAVMGKNEGDDLSGLTEASDLEQNQISEFFAIVDAAGICNSQLLQSKGGVLLQNAGARFLYDFETFRRTGRPVVAASVIREEHATVDPASPLRLSFEYSSGLGQVIMKKIQAESGVAKQAEVKADGTVTITGIDTTTTGMLRWIGNGRTIVNNKGNPVMQFEPLFSVTPKFENEKELVETGVTSRMYYDPTGRLIKTEMPDGTFASVEFDGWKQISWDANDNVGNSIWYARRTDATRSDFISDSNEQESAGKSNAHADTPGQIHFDSLGRAVLHIEHNRFGLSEEFYRTKLMLDIEGNLRSVTDAREISENALKGNKVMEYKYDMLGNLAYQKSMDAGERWIINNALGQPLSMWDARGHRYSFEYNDPLHRLTAKLVHFAGDPESVLFALEVMKYGETASTPETRNLRGQLWKHYDSSGLTEIQSIDFKGNLLEVTKQLTNLHDVKAIDWSVNPTAKLESEVFTKTTVYDALNRMVSLQNWASPQTKQATYKPAYSKRGLLEGETVSIDGVPVNALTSLTYDEKGQRLSQSLGCGTKTTYGYDPLTFRLKSMLTSPPGGGTDAVQKLAYTYDAAGNITYIEDDAFKKVYFNNQVIEPTLDYRYDAVYRLRTATGRENNSFDQAPRRESGNDIIPIDPSATRAYTQHYSYDSVGNITLMRHVAGAGSQVQRWTREYHYETNSNRLRKTTLGAVDEQTYQHDDHGSIVNLGPTPAGLGWNYDDMITKANLEGGGVAYYTYDSNKQRKRKRIERGGFVEDRIYLEGFEIYRKTGTAAETIETHHLFSASERVLIIENVRATDSGLPIGKLCRYQYSNHLGSVGLELNAQANIISYEEYHPYGTLAYRLKNDLVKSAAKRYRYTGMERDKETGLSYHSARYYVPWLARWGSADPASIKGGINLFEFVNGDPVQWTDKIGMQGAPWGPLNLMNEIGEFLKPVTNAIKHAEEAVRGVGDAVGDMAKGMNPVERSPATLLLGPVGALAVDAAKLGMEMANAYVEGGRGGWGVWNAVNTLNPAYHALVRGSATNDALDKGDYRTAAREGVFALAATGSTVAVATGVGSAVAGAGRAVAAAGDLPAAGAAEGLGAYAKETLAQGKGPGTKSTRKVVEPASINGSLVEPSQKSGVFYHGSSYLHPDQFLSGLSPKGSNRDLVNHAIPQTNDSFFRGGTVLPGEAANWTDGNGYVLKISGVPGWDVNALLEGRRKIGLGFEYKGNIMTGEMEHAIPGRIPTQVIEAYSQVTDGKLGPWIKNPGFKPPGDSWWSIDFNPFGY